MKCNLQTVKFTYRGKKKYHLLCIGERLKKNLLHRFNQALQAMKGQMEFEHIPRINFWLPFAHVSAMVWKETWGIVSAQTIKAHEGQESWGVRNFYI